jgi:hypothetical protein
MPTLTVNIVGGGASEIDGTTSTAGHMWYTLNPGNGGAFLSYGFAPQSSG